MRKLTILLLCCILFNCNEDTKKGTTPETTPKASATQEAITSTKTTTVIPFLLDTKALEQDTSANPIESFTVVANTKAANRMKLTKGNIKSALATAKKYKHTVIVVGNHTLVKVTDHANCKASASWGACMPYAEGYVKKGELQPQADYINNIIGLPDAQERVMYLFN